jgi:hypothetical protein
MKVFSAGRLRNSSAKKFLKGLAEEPPETANIDECLPPVDYDYEMINGTHSKGFVRVKAYPRQMIPPTSSRRRILATKRNWTRAGKNG